MGLRVSVFRRSGGDCSMNGLSARYDNLTIMNVSGPFNPKDDAPAALLVKGNLPGYVKIVPEDYPPNRLPMFGGNFAYTSDSRFHEAVAGIIGAQSYGAVPIHDRFEG